MKANLFALIVKNWEVVIMLFRIILLTLLLLLFAIAIFAAEPAAEPFCPTEYQYILKYPVVAETTCDSGKEKEYPCEIRVAMGEKKNVIFLVVYDKKKEKVIYISVNELFLGEGMVIFDVRTQL